MGLNTSLEAALTGLGVSKLSGANQADALLASAVTIPAGATGADIEVVTGQLFVTNDGSAATANSFLIDTGTIWRIRNSAALLALVHIFASATFDVRIAWWK